MIEIIRKRRSIRKFKPQPIEPEKIDLLKEAALRAPTSRNRRPWEFIFVEKKQILADLAAAKEEGSKFLDSVALAVFIMADRDVTDVWIEDCSIAAAFIQLTAESLDLGSCWVQIRKRPHSERLSAEEYVRWRLNIPPVYRVEAIIGLGYPDEEKKPIPFEELDHSKIVSESY